MDGNFDKVPPNFSQYLTIHILFNFNGHPNLNNEKDRLKTCMHYLFTSKFILFYFYFFSWLKA